MSYDDWKTMEYEYPSLFAPPPNEDFDPELDRLPPCDYCGAIHCVCREIDSYLNGGAA